MTAPLLGPLAAAPEVAPDVAGTMLTQALADVAPLGVWDRQVRGWITLMDPAYIATVASWCRRSWQAGVEVGRAECAEEIEEYHRRVQAARAELDALRARRP